MIVAGPPVRLGKLLVWLGQISVVVPARFPLACRHCAAQPLLALLDRYPGHLDGGVLEFVENDIAALPMRWTIVEEIGLCLGEIETPGWWVAANHERAETAICEVCGRRISLEFAGEESELPGYRRPGQVDRAVN